MIMRARATRVRIFFIYFLSYLLPPMFYKCENIP